MDPEGTAAPAPTQEAAEATPPLEEERNSPAPEAPAVAAAGQASRAEAEELAREVMELGLQNEYLRFQIAGAYPAGCADEGSESELVRGLKEQVERLSREVQEHRQTREAAERALEHVNVSYAEADSKVQELTAKLAEG
jgi:predicted RNase H-like nuclease (RuvC/YqgF family)